MTTFSFYVYNKRTKQNHYQSRTYDTDSLEKAKEIFLNESGSWRYDLISVEIHTPKKTSFFEGDFSTEKCVKRTILV